MDAAPELVPADQPATPLKDLGSGSIVTFGSRKSEWRIDRIESAYSTSYGTEHWLLMTCIKHPDPTYVGRTHHKPYAARVPVWLVP